MNSKAKTQKYIVVTIEALASSFPRLADPELTRLEVVTGMGEPWESHGSIGWEREQRKREKVGFIENTAMRHRWGG